LAGMSDFLTKPVLAKTLEAALHRSKLRAIRACNPVVGDAHYSHG
jgi:hypothetical protein